MWTKKDREKSLKVKQLISENRIRWIHDLNAQCKSVTEIARTLRVSRDTVYKALAVPRPSDLTEEQVQERLKLFNRGRSPLKNEEDWLPEGRWTIEEILSDQRFFQE